MADTAPSTSKSAPKGGKAKAVEDPKPPFKPAKYGTYERQVADYIKTATSKNIWYYRCEKANELSFMHEDRGLFHSSNSEK